MTVEMVVMELGDDDSGSPMVRLDPVGEGRGSTLFLKDRRQVAELSGLLYRKVTIIVEAAQ